LVQETRRFNICRTKQPLAGIADYFEAKPLIFIQQKQQRKLSSKSFAKELMKNMTFTAVYETFTDVNKAKLIQKWKIIVTKQMA
jgi:phosphoribosylamine-glycine ligase